MSELVDRIYQITGHRFRDEALLLHAFTHASYWQGGPSEGDYQRLEFLGDAVAGLGAAAELYERLPDADEGTLTKERQKIITTRDAFLGLSRHFGLVELVRLGKGERSNAGGRPKIEGDLVESLLGALAIDAGIAQAVEIARVWYRQILDGEIKAIAAITGNSNPKGDLQEWTQAHNLGVPDYRELSRTGEDHKPVFTIEVAVGGKVRAEGSGRSRKEAEQRAAAITLRELIHEMQLQGSAEVEP